MSDPLTEPRFKCRINGEQVPASAIQGAGGTSLRPQHVFGYYSGPSNRLEEHFATHQERFYRDLIRDVDAPIRRLFYARNVHSNFVLLSFFLEYDAEVDALLSEQLGIEGLDSVLFVMQQPSWKGRKDQGGDPRFWYARGTVRSLLDRLYSLALAPMRVTRRIPIGISRTGRVEQLFLYLPGLNEAQQLASGYANNQEFFKALESTYISELISDVRIRVRVRRASAPLTFRELSEGEQQLLLVLGLMRFTKEEESLFLLDEPDTHLNPAWSVQYRRFLETFGALDGKSHVLMATHDPLVVAGLTRAEVRILEGRDSGKIIALEPMDDPKGMGVGVLLTSDVYGLRSQLDLDTLDILDRKRFLSAQLVLSAQEEDELARLSQELRELGLLMEDRDPEFQAYLQAKYRRLQTDNRDLNLTQEEIANNRDAAEALVREVLLQPDPEDLPE